MTRQFICVYVEDREGDQTTYRDLIEEAWRRISTIQIETELISDPSEVEPRLEAGGVDLLIVDILFGDPAEPRGLFIINSAKRRYPDLPVIALSIGNGGTEERARKAGADEYVSKFYTSHDDVDLSSLGSKLRSAIEGCGGSVHPVDPKILKFADDSLLLRAVVERVGEDLLVRLLSRLVDGHCQEITISFVAPGYSGAEVMDAYVRAVDQGGGTIVQQRLLAKLSRDSGLIEDESTKQELVEKRFPRNLFVVQRAPRKVVAEGGWHAIATPFVGASSTLLSFLSSSSSGVRAVPRILEQLFSGDQGLASVYRQIAHDPAKRAIFPYWNMLAVQRSALLLLTVADLEPLAIKYDPSGSFDADLIRRFLLSKRVGELDFEEFPLGASTSLAHGDLHCRNVLIDDQQRAFVIDAGSVGDYPLGEDIAQLIVDIVVSCVDSDYRRYEWDEVAYWTSLALDVIDGGKLDRPSDDRAPKRAITALKWLRSRALPLVGGGDRQLFDDWQFELALAVEFLRVAYRSWSQPAPKRVLALLAACDALRAAEKSLLASKERI